MAARDCIDAVKKASGREMTDQEATDIFEALEDRIKRTMRAQGLDRARAVRLAGKELSDEMKLAAALEKRAAAINAVVWEELGGRYVEGRELDALRALVSGFTGRRGRDAAFRNAGLSVSALNIAAKERATGALLADLDRVGLTAALKRRNRDFEADVSRELWRVDNPEAGPATGNVHAEQAAKILSKHMEIARLAQNEAGAWIGKIDGYLGRQSHDAYRISRSYEAWRDNIEPRLAERTFDGLETPAEREGFLKATWQSLGSGIHDQPNADWMGYQGVGSLAKRVAQHRKLHFKSADAWMEYNSEFGRGTVVDAVMHTIEQGHINASTMRVLGTNPQKMMERLTREWAERAKARDDLNAASDVMKAFGPNAAILDRAMNRPIPVQNQSAAYWGQTTRNAMNFKLGGMMLSSFSDLSNVMANARHNGVGVFESFSNQIAGLLPGDSAARREMAREAGWMVDGFHQSISNRWNVVDGPEGKMSGLNQLFFRMTGQNWWTENHKEAHGYMMMKIMGRKAGDDLSSFDAMHQTSLRRYGIEAKEWDVIRQAGVKHIDGDTLLAPADILNLPDEAVAGFITKTKTANVARRELHEKYSTYLIDNTREAMAEPTAYTRHLMTGGSLPAGSGWGEIARLTMQFKSFWITNLVRNMARELYREGANVPGLALTVVGGSMLAYVGFTLKDIAAGREPRKMEDAGDYAANIFRALAQGGGLGLMGDFAFGEQNKYGGGILDSVVGPTISTAADVGKLLVRLREGDMKKSMAESLGIFKQLPPASALNLFYTRAAADYFIFWQLQEAINPGYMQRWEARTRRENNQDFWLSPAQAVR